MNVNKSGKEFFLPFILTGLVIILDQISKAYIVTNWPETGTLIKDVFDNGFLYIIHVRNKAIAFSLGDNIPEQFRYFLFVIVPIAVLAFLIWYYFKSPEFSLLQRWAIAGIIGGGIGNIIDRIFLEDGVVDFISVKFYGLLGMERWPTFNIADSSVVICCIILLITMIIKSREEDDDEEEEELQEEELQEEERQEAVVAEELQEEMVTVIEAKEEAKEYE